MRLNEKLLVCLAFLLFHHSTVKGLVTQPNGSIVPVDSMIGEVQLYTFFADQGEDIDWQNDAHDEPDTFSPLCEFTATLMLRETSTRMGIGWYNASPGLSSPPEGTEIYTVVPADAEPGVRITGSSIRQDPNYRGGEIGFALIRTPPHFTQSHFNTECNGGSCAANPGHWILGISYKSTKIENAWYLAFEDGDATDSDWSNDGDYNDYVFLLEGLACSGAGRPCTIEQARGVCAEGLTECNSDGELVCRKLQEPQDEACDGMDNDCDGDIDEGDDLCTDHEVCVRGTCVPFCAEEFPCLSNEICEEGVCVHRECAGKVCETGLACIEGICRSPCQDVICPKSQICRVGNCIDPCQDVACNRDSTCFEGVCVPSCLCWGCPDGEICQATKGTCIEPNCLEITCREGTHCSDGVCVDDCIGVICPGGQTCINGWCLKQDIEPTNDGSDSLPGQVSTNVQLNGNESDSVKDDGVTSSADSAVGYADQKQTTPESCGCRVLSLSPSTRGWFSVLFIFIGFLISIRLYVRVS